MKKNSYKTFITILLILAVAVLVACIIVTVLPTKRTSKAQEYALECGPQYVKLPKEKCEIKEAK